MIDLEARAKKYLEDHGYHVIPKGDFYQPIASYEEIKNWGENEKSSLDIRMNETAQLKLLIKLCRAFPVLYPHTECSAGGYYAQNGYFGLISAKILYAMIRHFQPNAILEIGSGWSSKVISDAKRKLSHDSTYCIIDPYAKGEKPEGLTVYVGNPVQEDGIAYARELQEDDILFIDTSHALRPGGDVQYLILKVLPILKKGVVIHFHDVFLPYEYPKEWVVDKRRNWTEQYILQAFLYRNPDFKVLLAQNYFMQAHKELLRNLFSELDIAFINNYYSSSFWIQKVK